MPIHHAILALLADRPSHGYELKGAFDQAVGPQWGALNIGHLYQVLERLSRDGHVRSSRVAQDDRPDRVMYEITASGRGELAEWIGSPSPRTAGFRDDFFLKIMAAAHSGEPGQIGSTVRVQRAFLLREMHNLETLRATHTEDPVVRLLLLAAVRHVSADLAFLDDVEESLLRDGGAALARIASSAGVTRAARSKPESAARRRSA